MKIIFSHGKESGPWGTKINALADLVRARDLELDSIDYRDLPDDPEARVDRLAAAVEAETQPVVLVGSSMGGYVSTVVSCRMPVAGLFLMAPAFYISGYEVQEYPSQAAHIEVVHGWSDNVIPVELSMRFGRARDCTVHMISGDHRLNSSLEELKVLFDDFLDRL